MYRTDKREKYRAGGPPEEELTKLESHGTLAPTSGGASPFVILLQAPNPPFKKPSSIKKDYLAYDAEGIFIIGELSRKVSSFGESRI